MFGLEVFLVGTGLYTRVVAQRTRVILPAGVPHLMLAQRVVVGGPEAALVARERLLAGVRSFVELQRAGHGGRVPANAASVRPDPDVHAGNVLVQQVSGAEVAATVVARQLGLRRRLPAFHVDHLWEDGVLYELKVI